MCVAPGFRLALRASGMTGVDFKHRMAFGPACAVRDAVHRGPQGGPGTRGCPAGLACRRSGLPVERSGSPRPRNRWSSAGSRRCFTSWSLEPTAAGPGCSGRSPVLSLRWLREAAFRRATPLDHTIPASLNIATARLAGVVMGVCVGAHRWGMERAAFPTADCWNGVVNNGFRGALSPIWRGGFRGIWSAVGAVTLPPLAGEVRRSLGSTRSFDGRVTSAIV